MDTKQHYEQHLHSHYSWIYGGAENKIEENRAFFNSRGITPASTKIALDLGAGTGFQSIPLAELGFEVKAVDFSSRLLEELNSRKGALDIETIEDDILSFSADSKLSPELIVCMGDTLTHLEDIKAVEDLVANCSAILCAKGKIIFTFRDLTSELENEKRFIPVRSDDNTIFTCFLEYYPDYLKVFDIVHEKGDGKWNQKISFYRKIKISSEKIKDIFIKAGIEIEFFDIRNGLITIIGSKN